MKSNIQQLILEDMRWKMKFWRATAIFILIITVALIGLFTASEFELAHAKRQLTALENGTQDYYCHK